MSPLIRIPASLLLSFMLFAGPASAQLQRWVDEEGTAHYTAPPGERGPEPSPVAKIPFTAGLPVPINAKINGAGPVTLILDTGADRTMVTPEALARLGISPVGPRQHRVQGVGGTVDAAAVWVDSVEVGEVRAGPLLVIVHDPHLKQADGLLGRDFLNNFTVTIDSKEGILTLERK